MIWTKPFYRDYDVNVFSGMMFFLHIFLFNSVLDSFAIRSAQKTGDLNKRLRYSSHTILYYTYLLPIVFLAIVVIFFMADSNLNRLVLKLQKLLVLIILYNGVLLLLTPALRKRYSSLSCACLWLLPNTVILEYFLISSEEFTLLPRVNVLTPQLHFGVWAIVWGVGAAAVLIWKIGSHLVFRWRIRRHSKPVEQSAFDLFLLIRAQSFPGRPIPPRPVVSALVRSPLTIGLTYRTAQIVLPPREYSSGELALIYRHELTHLMNHDNNAKLYMTILCAVCWFLPPVWLGLQRSAEDLELSCDEQASASLSEDAKHQYANLLLTSAGPATGFTTCLSASAKNLRYRLQRILHSEKRRNGTVLIVVFNLLLLLAANLFVITPKAGTFRSVVFYDQPSTAAAASADPSDGSDTPAWQTYLADQSLYLTDWQPSDRPIHYIAFISFSGKTAAYHLYFWDHYVQIDEYPDKETYGYQPAKHSVVYLVEDSLDPWVLWELLQEGNL